MPTELDELERGLRAGEPATEARARARMDEASRVRDVDVVIRVGTALGTYLAARGRLVAAREAFERVVDAAERAVRSDDARSARLRVASLCADAHEFDEAERLVARVTAEAGLSEEDLVRVALVRTMVARHCGSPRRARELLEEVRARCSDTGKLARVDYHLGVVALDTGDRVEAERRLRSALGPSTAGQRPFVLLNLAELERLRGHLDEAERLLDAASGDGDHHLLAISLPMNRALIDVARGVPQRALERLERLLATPHVADVPWARFVASALGAGLAADCGAHARARAHVHAAWALRSRGHHDTDVVDALERAGAALAGRVRSRAAARCAVRPARTAGVGAAAARRHRPPPPDRPRRDGRRVGGRAVLDRVAPGRDGRLRVAFQRALVAHALQEPDVEERFREVLRFAPSRGRHARVATQWLALLADERDRPADVLALLLPLRTDHPGAIALVVSATVQEPAGRCDAWIAELEAHPAPTRDPRTRLVLTRAITRARGAGADARADRLDALIRRDGKGAR